MYHAHGPRVEDHEEVLQGAFPIWNEQVRLHVYDHVYREFSVMTIFLQFSVLLTDFGISST